MKYTVSSHAAPIHVWDRVVARLSFCKPFYDRRGIVSQICPSISISTNKTHMPFVHLKSPRATHQSCSFHWKARPNNIHTARPQSPFVFCPLQLLLLFRERISEALPMTWQLTPMELRSIISSGLSSLTGQRASELSLVIEEFHGCARNQVFYAANTYLAGPMISVTSEGPVGQNPHLARRWPALE